MKGFYQNNLKLVVFSADPIIEYYKKGEVKERYYNPNNLFEEVHIITLSDKEVEEEKVQKLVGNAKLKIYPVGKLNPKKLYSQKKKILKLVREINPSAIRAYSPAFQGYMAAYCGRKLNIPSVISLHGDGDEERAWRKSNYGFFNHLRFHIYTKLFEKPALSGVDKVVCVTNFLTNYAKKYGARDVEVIYNKVDTKRFKNFKTRNNKGKLTILCVGRQNKQKNQQCLIRAIKDLDVKLILIGKGEMHNYLKNLTKELGVENKVEFIESVPHSEIHKYYERADIFAIATYFEGFCIPLAEAMACSLPIVASDKEPLPEVIGGGGIIVKNNPEEFKGAFERLISSPQLRKKLGDAGKKRSKLYDSETIEKQESQMYQKLISKVSDQVSTLEGGVRFLHKERMNYLEEKVRQIKNERGKIKALDIGCGDGMVTQHLLNALGKEDEVIGMDSDEVRLFRLKKRYPGLKSKTGDASNIPFKSNTFDIILMHHVIEHVPGHEKVIAECFRVLKKGGYLIIGVPHEGGTLGKMIRKVHFRMYKNSKKVGWHVNFYSRKNMADLLRGQGFTVKDIGGIGFLFPFYPVHNFILDREKLFLAGHKLTKKIKFTADSLFFIAQK